VLVAGEETDEVLGTWRRVAAAAASAAAAAAEVVAHPAVAERERERERGRERPDHTRHAGCPGRGVERRMRGMRRTAVASPGFVRPSGE
jgi:hypothetical protein